jgi:hypothetical protein
MPILGFCANAFRVACHIDFQPLGLREGLYGVKFKISIVTFSQHKQFIRTYTDHVNY